MHTSSASDISPREFPYPVPSVQFLNLGVMVGKAAAKPLCLLLQELLLLPTDDLDELSLNTDRKLQLPPARAGFCLRSGQVDTTSPGITLVVC